MHEQLWLSFALPCEVNNNQLQHTHKHKTEKFLGEFCEWPNKTIPELPENYVWDFVYPLHGNTNQIQNVQKLASKNVPQSIQNIQNMKSVRKTLDMTCASLAGLPGTPTKTFSVNQSILAQILIEALQHQS